jgi:hypothetical protein
MAQTTTALSAVNAKIEFSSNGSSWTDISGSSNSIDPGEQTRQSGEVYTFSGDTAVITAGKREPMELEAKILFTPTAGEAWETARAAFETAGGAGYLRWSPQGGTTGNKQYTTPAGVLTGLSYPPAAADDAKPVMVGLKLKVAYVTESTVA